MSAEPIIRKRPKTTSRARRQLGLLLFSLLVIAALTAGAYYFLVPREEEFVLRSYRYAVVTSRDFRELVTIEGVLTPRTTVDIEAPAAGTLEQILVQAGDDVAAGDVIGRIHSESLEEKLEETRRALEAAETELKSLELENGVKQRQLERDLAEAKAKRDKLVAELPMWRKLYELGDIAQAELEAKEEEALLAGYEYEDLEITYEATNESYALEIEIRRDEIEDLRKELRELEETYAELEITAPIAGRVLQVAVDEGREVGGGDLLVRIADLGTSYVEAEAPVDAVAELKVGQQAEVVLLGDTCEGQVNYIAPQASDESGGVLVEIALQELPGALVPGSSCLVDVEVGRKDGVPALPRDHYLTSGDSMYLFVIDEEAKVARRRPARFGLIEGSYVEVLWGAEVGDQVIVSSYDEFVEKEEIRILAEGGTKI